MNHHHENLHIRHGHVGVQHHRGGGEQRGDAAPFGSHEIRKGGPGIEKNRLKNGGFFLGGFPFQMVENEWGKTGVDQLSHEKKRYYFPLYWLVKRDPYSGL